MLIKCPLSIRKSNVCPSCVRSGGNESGTRKTMFRNAYIISSN